MANQARDARLANNTRGFDQVVERGRGFLKMRHATNPNRFSFDTQVEATWHFGNAPYSEANEIDTAWQVGDSAPYRRRMILADYHAFAGLNDGITFNAGQIVKYVHPATGANVTFQPQQLQWTNDLDQIQVAGSVAAVGATVNDSILRWTNAFGTGRHFEWQTEPSRLTKRLIVDTLASLPVPNATILAGSNPVLRLQFIFQKSAGVSVYVDGVLWNEASNNPRTTTGVVEFKSGSTLLWAFTPPLVWDSGTGNNKPVQRIRKQGANLFVEVRVPYTWIQSAVFPIVIDPTIDAQVGAGANDGYWWEPGTYDNSDVNLRTGRHYDSAQILNAWYRFTGVTISGTIDVAYISLSAREFSGSTVLSKIFGDDQSEPSAVSSASNGNSRTRTTAGVDWDITVWSDNVWYNSPSIVSVIQELVDSYTFSSSALQILHDDDGTTANFNYINTDTYESSSTLAAKLHIEYTVGGAASLVFDDRRQRFQSLLVR